MEVTGSVKNDKKFTSIHIGPVPQVSGARLAGLVPGVLVLAGLTRAAQQELALGNTAYMLLAVAMLALAAGLLLQWERSWQALSAIAVGVAACVLAVAFWKPLSDAMTALAQPVSRWLLLRTGHYASVAGQSGNMLPVLVPGALLIGVLTAALVRGHLLALPAVALSVLWAAGLLANGWALVPVWLGALLSFSRGRWHGMGFSAALALVLAAAMTIGLTAGNFTPTQGRAGRALEDLLHHLRWEQGKNPLPEGDLTDLGAWQPGSEAALDVTMDSWSGLYLRGFVGGSYTSSGWEQVPDEALESCAGQLYALQSDFFYGGTQISAAWQSLQQSAQRRVEIRLRSACRAWSYLPYGAAVTAGDVLRPGDLLGEGQRVPASESYSLLLYDVSESYRLQSLLAQSKEETYRTAEGVYRDWVYRQYLAVPEQVRSVLSPYLQGGTYTTVQARQEILSLLSRHLNYAENILTETGDMDFCAYVMEVSRSGYSVHYATLATMLLRCCGIPARYVEGYVITDTQAQALRPGQGLTLTAKNAHAWAEYYLDGVGWLPFDATPGYEQQFSTNLPGTAPSETEPEPTEPSTTAPEQTLPPQFRQDPLPNSQSISPRQYWVLLAVLLLLLLAAILRTVLLRKRLRARLRPCHGSDPTRSCATALCYMQEVMAAMGHDPAREPVSIFARQAAQLSRLPLSAAELETVANQTFYGHAPMPEQARQEILACLTAMERTWRQRVPALRRWRQKYLSCKIL